MGVYMTKQTTVMLLIVALILGGGSYFVGSGTGYENGVVDGYALGYTNGTIIGYRDGVDVGIDEGYADGYTQGKTDGLDELNKKVSDSYREGKSIGLEEGNASGYLIGYDKGHESGFSEGFSTTGYQVRDITKSELLKFLKNDKTDKIEHNETFDCENYAAVLKQNAFNKGYQCYIVLIEFEESAHVLNAFNTTDKGFLYVEPQTDDIVDVRLHSSYWDRTKFRVNYNDIVTEIVIYP